MDVGQQDGVDAFRRYADGAQAVGELAERRPERVAGAGIDQRAGAVELEQKCVHRDVHGLAGPLAGKPLGFGLLDPEHHVERGREHAVAERGHPDVADLNAACGHGSSLQIHSVGSLSRREREPIDSQRRLRSHSYEPGTIWISSLSWPSLSGAGRNLNWTASLMLSSRPEMVAVCRLSFGMKSLSMSRTAGSDRPENAR